ncbi:MAG TPA: SDR family NAD(P)-dependent oxidoreductase [Burkholderiales bacterium]|nr:SDR family NAD(P)-dependent oxidoreductase [Burkholderiales bacterium]
MLKGRVAMVTGAAGGFGTVLARALLAEGASVAALDVNESGLAVLGRAVTAEEGKRLLVMGTDVSDYAACERAVAATIGKLGGLHIVVNNGALGMGAIRTDHMVKLVGIREITPQTWQRFLSVNLTGAWNMTRAAIGHLLDQRWGRIVNITTSFFTMLRGGFHPYGPSKAGLEAMAAGHAQEFAGTGVTVNVVVPGGPSDTPMVPAESGFDRKDLIPPGVMAPPILWLCSAAANGITGNRYVAAHWDTTKSPQEAAQGCSAPIAWPDLAASPVWPGGRPGA